MNLKKLETNFEMESFYLILVFFLGSCCQGNYWNLISI